MIRCLSLLATSVCLILMGVWVGCGPTTPAAGPSDADGTPSTDGGDQTPTDGTGTAGDDTGTPGDDTGTTAGLLKVKVFTDTLGQAARILPSGQDAPDDVDVNLTPTEYTVAFKRIVLKEVDEATEETLSEVEVFSAETVDDALIVDLLNATALDLLDIEDLPAGTYNKVDIEVFYLDMTVPTLYPGSTSYDIPYRMVFEEMGVLEPRDFLLYLDPEWMAEAEALAAQVTEAGWYWMEMGNPDHVEPVADATAHPTFHVLDLFANEEFWSSEHKVLEGGRISPPLEYDPDAGGVLTITFDVTGKFNFKDWYDETTEPDGQWEIRRDGGIHPFPPDFECWPEAPDTEEPAS